MTKVLSNCRLLTFFLLSLCASLSAREQKITTPRKKNSIEQSEISPYAWKDPKVAISRKPSLTGRQVGIVETPGMAQLGYLQDGDVKVFRLTAQPVEQLVTDGDHAHHNLLHAMKNILGINAMPTKKKINAWGYNGSTPGPLLELTVGDRVRVIFKNELPEPTLIHWHGLEYPCELDRSSDRNLVLPGETHIYEFTAYQEGTYLYHSGCSIAKQNRFGLVGMIIVHAKAYEETIDRHIAILLQEWALSPNTPAPNTAANQFNWFTMNGNAAPCIPIITLDQGERVRIHVGSMATNAYPLYLHGYTWTLVGTEGGPIQKTAQIKGATLHVPPGTTRTIEFDAWNPGTWPFYALTKYQGLSHSSEVSLDITPHGGMFTLVEVVPTDHKTNWVHHSETNEES